MNDHISTDRPFRRPLIAVIGDAKLQPGSPKDVLAEDVGRALVDAGYRVLTGGLGGVMEAACRGARHSASYQPGDTVGVLPGHDPNDANGFVDIAIPTGLDHVRNSVVAHADAVIAIGGGAGTMSEVCLAWIYKRLIVGMRVEGWSGRVADQQIDQRVRTSDGSDCVFGANSATEAVHIINLRLQHYGKTHRGIVRRDS